MYARGLGARRRNNHASVTTNTMAPPTQIREPLAAPDEDHVFELAAELLRALAAPMRLKIISALCNGEKNVTELLAAIETTQPNMSQHLNTLYQAGVLGRRREGVSIYYRSANEQAVGICRSICVQIAIEQE